MDNRETGHLHADVNADQGTALFPYGEPQPLDLQLTADEIHVWLGVLDQPVPECCRFERTLSSDERLRAGRYHKQEDRNRFIVRQGMLRMILGRYLGVKASELRFHRGKNGKPALSGSFGKATIFFNLSHSTGAALFAFARNQELGVDIERIRDIAEMERIVERFFSARERSFIRALPPDQRRDAFFYCWTRKEAYVKALGEGLSRPLDSFDVVPVHEGGAAGTIDEDRCLSQWSIKTLSIAHEYASALAIKTGKVTLRYFNWATRAFE